MIQLWFNNKISMIARFRPESSFNYGLTIRLRWFSYTSTMVQLWFNNKISMVARFRPESSMLQLWFNYGLTIRLPYFNYGSTTT